MTKMCYDILLSSLSKNYMTPNAKPITEKWVRRIWADSLSQAEEFAKSLHTDLGLVRSTRRKVNDNATYQYKS